MKIDEKDEIFDRKSAQGSVYDKMYFTDDQLKQGAEINQKAASGEISWDSAHNWWENTRSGYGYSGGEDGHGYTTLANKAKENTPSYVNQYQGAINQAANALMNRKAFTYDHNTDPMYQQYADSYTRQGQQAMEDTLAQVSARTGGLASSYAGTAAQQTYNGYMSALADKVPELRQLAYQMYMDEGDTIRQNLQMLQGLEATEYGRYRDSVADDQWQQAFDTQNSQWQQDFNFEKGLTAASLLAQAGNYSGYKDLFGLSEDDMAALQAGHISQKDLQAAELLAQAGDFSGYQKIFNLSPEKVAKLEKAYQQQNAPKVTGGGGGTPTQTKGWSDVEDWEKKYGEGAVEDYIGEHYKALGYSSKSAALSAWNNYKLEAQPKDVWSVDSVIRDDFNNLLEGGATPELIGKTLENWLTSGYRGITEKDVEALLDSAGLLEEDAK